MRRLKKSDPAFAIFGAYAVEHADRWGAAKALTLDEALGEIPEIERKYQLECTEYANVVYGISDEFTAASKLELEQLHKLVDADQLQSQLDSGAIVALEGGSTVTDSASVAACLEEFDSQR